MSTTMPEVRHIYQNHFLDSTRWQAFSPRSDDVIIATPYKSGTTWMQIIVMHLIFQDFQTRPIPELSPWLDLRFNPLTNVIKKIDGQEHRRFIKTHLPLDGLPYYEQVIYIVIGRDARDVFMSLWNHYGVFTDEDYGKASFFSPGAPLPRRPKHVREFWKWWINNGWFEWESEGYPFWSNMRHVQTWWNFKHLPNILFVHFNDLLANLAGEIQRVAAFLEIDLSPKVRSDIAEAVTFKNLKAKDVELLQQEKFLIHKGTNGRWRTVLNAEDLEMYRAAVARELSPDCACWLEKGRKP